MTDDDAPIDPGVLDAWTPLAPPTDFADRVLAARAVPVPRARRWPVVAGGLAIVAAAAVALVIATRPAPSLADRGELTAAERVEHRLGARGVVVAEADSVVRWTIARDGSARVEQPSGNVFYRIERGESFVVQTPAGDVRVTGTCFRIEVTPMNKKLVASGAAGAALAAAVTITVYEGRVVADSRGGKTELVAGTRATIDHRGTRVEPDSASIASAADDTATTRDELLARTTMQRSKIAALEARVKELEASGGGGGGGKHPVDDVEPGRTWFDPSPEMLQQFAAECRVRVDEPGLSKWQPLDANAKFDEVTVTPADIAAYNKDVGEVAKQWQALVRALYIEATGDTTGVESLSLDAMKNEIAEKSTDEERTAILRKVSAERAGLQQPPADLSKTSPLERLMRAQLDLGNKVEAALAKQLGPARARELRGEGWGNRSDWSGCRP